MTDDDLIAGYLEHLRWCNRAQTTIDIRRTYLTKLSRDLGPLGNVKAKRLRKWLADPQRGLEASSQGVLLSAFHSFFNWARRERLLKKNPTLRIEKPATPKGEPHPITDIDREKALIRDNGPIVGSRAKVEAAIQEAMG